MAPLAPLISAYQLNKRYKQTLARFSAGVMKKNISVIMKMKTNTNNILSMKHMRIILKIMKMCNASTIENM